MNHHFIGIWNLYRKILKLRSSKPDSWPAHENNPDSIKRSQKIVWVTVML